MCNWCVFGIDITELTKSAAGTSSSVPMLVSLDCHSFACKSLATGSEVSSISQGEA